MKMYLCVDDTDDMNKETSTGAVAEAIGRALAKEGAQIEEGISRHQLLLHPGISYTSHNSAMCLSFCPGGQGLSLERIEAIAEETILACKADTANPGLAICMGDTPQKRDALLAFGLRAKRDVLTQDQAYALAAEMPEVTLRALGGDGSGVIGALAGLGLRLSRNDGTFRGKKGVYLHGKSLTVAQMKDALGVEQIVDAKGTPLADHQEVMVEQFAKISLQQGKRSAVLSGRKKGNCFILSSEREEKKSGREAACCPDFLPDPDEEEQVGEGQSCGRCLYRRWTANGQECQKPVSSGEGA